MTEEDYDAIQPQMFYYAIKSFEPDIDITLIAHASNPLLELDIQAWDFDEKPFSKSYRLPLFHLTGEIRLENTLKVLL